MRVPQAHPSVTEYPAWTNHVLCGLAKRIACHFIWFFQAVSGLVKSQRQTIPIQHRVYHGYSSAHIRHIYCVCYVHRPKIRTFYESIKFISCHKLNQEGYQMHGALFTANVTVQIRQICGTLTFKGCGAICLHLLPMVMLLFPNPGCRAFI